MTACASTKIAAPSTNVKRTSPEWQTPRDEQELIRWAATLDQLHVPLIPQPGKPEWTYLLHLTFRFQIPRHHAMTAGQRLVRWTSAWRTQADTQGARLFRLLLWSVEEHKSGTVHAHALSVTTPAVSAKHCARCSERVSSLRPLWRQLKESWFIHNGIARVEPYKPYLKFGAERYVLKYVLKPTCLDWGIELQ